MNTHTPTRRWTHSLLAITGAVALVWIALSVLGRVYSGSTLLWSAGGASIAAAVVSVVLYRVRTPLLLVTLLSAASGVVYLLVITAVTAGNSEQSGSVAHLFLDAVQNSGARILTTSIPVASAPDTLALPVILSWVATHASAELLQRTRSVVPALAAPSLLYVIALVLVGPNRPAALFSALVFLAVAGVVLALTSRASLDGVLAHLQRATVWKYVARRGAVTLAGITVLILASSVLGSAVAGLTQRTPDDPRKYVPPPVNTSTFQNPLAKLAYWAQHPDEELFTVTTSQPSRINWAVLSEYDGVTWQADLDYASAGSVLPARERADDTESITQEYSITNLSGVWVPAVATATEVEKMRVAYDDESGTLLQLEGVQDAEYTVRSERPVHNVRAMRDANATTDSSLDAYRHIEDVPESIRTLATDIVGAADTGYAQSLLLEQHFTENYVYNAEASSGHAYPNLAYFLNTPLDEGGHQGTSEQFAAAFTVMARSLGLPTRVVVGFHAGLPVENNTYLVRAGDAYAWPEVHLRGFGWVAFNPTPPENSEEPPPPEEATVEAQQADDLKAQQLQELESLAEQQPESEPQRRAANAANSGASSDETMLTRVQMMWVLLSVAVLAAVIVLLLRRWYLWRQVTAGPCEERILAAWDQVQRSMRRVQRRPGLDASATEIAEYAEKPLREKPLVSVESLAAAVNTVRFAPPSVGRASEEMATRARETLRAYRRSVRRALPWWRVW